MKKREFDKKLKYQGWEQMSAILDKEMPEKKRRKGLIIFFIVGLLIASLFVMNKLIESEDTIANYEHTEIAPTKVINTKEASIISKIKNNKSVHEATIIKEEKTNDKLGRKVENENNSKNSSYKNIDNRKYKSKKIINSFAINSNVLKKQEYFDKRNDLPTNTRQNKIVNDNILEINRMSIAIVENILTLPKNLSFNKIEIQIYKKKRLDLFSPFIGLKGYVFSTKEVKPKLELEVGNRFSYYRHFTDLSLSYIQSKVVVPRIVLYDDYNSDILSNGGVMEAKNTAILVNPNLRFGLFELNLAQGYRITKRFDGKIGVGLAYTMVLTNNSSKDFDSNNKPEGVSSFDEFDRYTVSSSIDLSYHLNDKFSFSLGYKHYYNSSYKLSYSNNRIYRSKVISNSKISRVNAGLRFWF